MVFSTFLFYEKYIILAVETWMERGGGLKGVDHLVAVIVRACTNGDVREYDNRDRHKKEDPPREESSYICD